MRTVVWHNVKGSLATPARRSLFSSPPLPPGFSPAPVASDAKPFFASGAQRRAPQTAAPISSSSSPSATSGEVPLNTASSVARCDVDRAKHCSLNEKGGKENNDNNANMNTSSNNNHCQITFLSPEALARHVSKPAKLAASLVADALGIPMTATANTRGDGGGSSAVEQQSIGDLREEYSEHCVLGWSPRDLYGVVADVSQYSTFLPWCLDSNVHHVGRLDDDTTEMVATLTVGFSLFKEQYASRVLLVPDKKVQAVLTESEKQRRNPVLSDLQCVWEFSDVPGCARQVEVRFVVGFAFTNPLHSKLIMSHVVSLMTRSFEKQCEKLYGPPSCQRRRLTASQHLAGREERQK